MNEEIVGKIKRLRVAKGLNQTLMADKLNITRSAYQKIESGESYAWAKYLDNLMEILETTPKDFFSDIGRKIINYNFKDGAIGYVETLHQENREIYEKLLASKDEQIALLKKLTGKGL